jgi:hypothetical protein
MNEYEVKLQMTKVGYVTVTAKDENEAVLLAMESDEVEWPDKGRELLSVKLIGTFDDDDVEEEEDEEEE